MKILCLSNKFLGLLLLFIIICSNSAYTKTLIIGSSGYVGGAIYNKLFDSKLPVIGSATSTKDNFIKYDFFTDDIRPIAKNFDTVIFAAAVENLAEMSLDSYRHAIKRFVAGINNKRLIYLSSDAIFDGEKGNYYENDIANPITNYGKRLKMFENQIQQYHKNYVIVRTSYVFGNYFSSNKLITDKRTIKSRHILSSGEIYPRATNIFKSPINVTNLSHNIKELIDSNFIGIRHFAGVKKSVHHFYYDRLAKYFTETELKERLIMEQTNLNGIPADTSLNSNYSQLLLKSLNPEQLKFLSKMNKDVVWGWKRDIGEQNRIVYFSSKITNANNQIYSSKPYLYYRHKTSNRAIKKIKNIFASATTASNIATTFGTNRYKLSVDSNMLSLEIGNPSTEDIQRVAKVKQQKPVPPQNPKYLPDHIISNVDLRNFFPADLYVGSGLSYEAGSPTHQQVHSYFDVDDYRKNSFTMGESDTLPNMLQDDLDMTLRRFFNVHMVAIKADPTPAQRTIKQLFDKNLVGKIYTDNVDNMLSKLDLPFENARKNSITNEIYLAEFKSKRLLVVGISADRRGIIKQARDNGMEIIIVNPHYPVSPQSKNLDYIQPQDMYFKLTAQNFFEQVDDLLST